MFAFVRGSDGYEVLTPIVKEHVFKAGKLKGESSLIEGHVYRLKGVTPAASEPKIDPHSNAVISGVRGVNRSRSKVFCSIQVPFPDGIFPLDFILNPVFEGAGADPDSTTIPHLEARPNRISEVLVFTYRFGHLNALTLNGLYLGT